MGRHWRCSDVWARVDPGYPMTNHVVDCLWIVSSMSIGTVKHRNNGCREDYKVLSVITGFPVLATEKIEKILLRENVISVVVRLPLLFAFAFLSILSWFHSPWNFYRVTWFNYNIFVSGFVSWRSSQFSGCGCDFCRPYVWTYGLDHAHFRKYFICHYICICADYAADVAG